MKNNQILRILIILFALMFVFISSDSNLKYQSDITLFFRKLFYNGLFHPRLFKLFDYLVILFSLSLINRYGINYIYNSKLLKLIFFLTIINTIFIFVNPNHAAEYMFLGLPLLSDISLYTGIIFTFSIFFVKEEGFLYFIKEFGKFVLLFASVKALFLFFLWFNGQGFSFWGFYSILMEEDNLLLFAFLQLLAFYLYNKTKTKKYFFIWVIFFLIEILSFRRSGLFVSVLTIILYLIYSNLRNSSVTKKTGFVFALLLIFFILLNSIQFLPYTQKLYVGRYIGEFISVPGIPQHLELFDNKHLEQAKYGLDAAFDILPFWGYGFGHDINKATLFYGSNSAIHNSYVAVWMYHSLVFTIYLVVLAFLIFYNLIKKSYSPHNTNFNVMIGIFLAVFFINHWVLPLANVVEIKMVVFRTLLIALFFRISKTNLSQVLGER